MDLANKDAASPLRTAKIEDVEMLDGKLRIKNDSSQSVNISELMRRNNLTEIDRHSRIQTFAGKRKIRDRRARRAIRRSQS